MNAHLYKPPVEFCEAVKMCPSVGSSEYQKKMIEAGGENVVSVMNKNHENIVKWIEAGEIKYFNMQNYESYNRTN